MFLFLACSGAGSQDGWFQLQAAAAQEAIDTRRGQDAAAKLAWDEKNGRPTTIILCWNTDDGSVVLLDYRGKLELERWHIRQAAVPDVRRPAADADGFTAAQAALINETNASYASAQAHRERLAGGGETWIEDDRGLVVAELSWLDQGTASLFVKDHGAARMTPQYSDGTWTVGPYSEGCSWEAVALPPSE